MQSGNSSSQNNRSEVNLFRKILFALACVAAFVFFVVLVQGKHRSDNALTGDLLTNGTFHTQEVPHSAFSSFFDYLGGVVYLFPLLVVFFGYRFFISRRGSLFRFDPFAISVVILGINVLIIGFSSIFDLVGRTGGVLGIFLNRNIVGLLPSSIEPILPIALVIAGICLVSGKSPLWFIDAIGSLCGRFIFRGEEKEQFEENKAEIKQTADNTEDLLKGFGSLDDSSFGPNEDGIKVIPKHQEKIEEKQSIKASLKALLSKFNKQKSNKKVQSSSLQRHEPSFGGRNSEESLPVAENITLKATSSNPFKDTVVDSLDDRRTDGETFAGFEKKDSKNTLFNESSAPAFSKDPFASTGAFENKVPAFNENKGSSTPSSFGRIDNQKSAEDKKADEPLHYLGPSMLSRAPGTSAPSWGTQEESNSSGGTSSTYITGMNSTASSASDAVVSESSCIISGTAVKDSRQNITSVKSTIVTKMNPPKTESLENEDRAIYRAGAQHLEPVKTVGSPSRHSEVSTVIIRTSTTPKVKLSADNSSMQGGYSQSSSIISREDERASMANPYEQSTNVAEDDDNIISFSDLVKPVENDSSIEVKNLSSDFVRNDQGKLNTPRSAPINESDEKYELYSRATRGVISSQTQPSGMSNKNSSIYAEANNQVPSAANSYSESQNTQIQQHSYNQTSAQYQSNTADTAPKTYTSSSASSNVPFESMSSLNGTVPNHLSDRPRAPVGSIPKVTYARATETIPSKEYGTWRPSLGLLTRSADSNQYDDEAFRVEVAQKAERINQFMKDYNVKGSVSNMALGPVITRYDVNLAPGVKSASLASLETDLQRYLITNKINIIPAVSSFVGIEVPNIKRKL
ncbi:MAG: DNA translocase FtsK, partial [Succinivibrio sp.]